MGRVNHLDVLSELVELSTEIIREIRHHLFYYNASVYKNDLASNIKRKVSNLRLVIEMSAQEDLVECFRDHDAMLENGPMQTAPGECAFAARTSRLVMSLEPALKDIDALLKSKYRAKIDVREMSRRISKRRRDLVNVCKHGSRHRAFFQML